MLESETSRKGLRLTLEIELPAEPLVADPLRIKQVLANYVSNAVKFTPQGGQIRIRSCTTVDRQLRIEVEDDGIGIADKDLPRLFSAFDQLSSGSTKSFEGIGLGLALCRRLVEAHGGRVGVRSRLGQGSLFFLELPRVPPTA